MRFTEFFLLHEKSDMAGDKFKSSMYIASGFDKDAVKEFYKNVDTSKAEEVETDPHVTFYYSPKTEKLNEDDLYEVAKKQLKGFNFKVKTSKYHVFEGVNQGTQDALVVKLDVDDEVKERQAKIQKMIEEAGGKAEQTYGGDWQPHMTIGYFKKGEVPSLPKVKQVEMEATDLFFQFGGSDKDRRSLS